MLELETPQTEAPPTPVEQLTCSPNAEKFVDSKYIQILFLVQGFQTYHFLPDTSHYLLISLGLGCQVGPAGGD